MFAKHCEQSVQPGAASEFMTCQVGLCDLVFCECVCIHPAGFATDEEEDEEEDSEDEPAPPSKAAAAATKPFKVGGCCAACPSDVWQQAVGRIAWGLRVWGAQERGCLAPGAVGHRQWKNGPKDGWVLLLLLHVPCASFHRPAVPVHAPGMLCTWRMAQQHWMLYLLCVVNLLFPSTLP